MKMITRIFLILIFLLSIISAPSYADNLQNTSLLPENESPQISSMILLAKAEDDEYMEDEDEDWMDDEDEVTKIADPIEPVNRFFFQFNDTLYFWILKPAATTYSNIVPETARISVRNFFNNLSTPVRMVNSLLQGKIDSFGIELKRFGLNSTVGVLGLFDPSRKNLGLKMQEEDLGQTLGVWFNTGPGFYIVWPVLGPSSLRDTAGLLGDSFLEPVSYVNPWLYDRLGIQAGDKLNRVSLVLGDYEEIKKDAIDPYTAIRDIYHQYRENKIDK